MKKEANEKIRTWKQVIVETINRETGEVFQVEIQSPEDVISWHKDPDVDVRIYEGGILYQYASAGVERRIRK